MKLPTFNLPPIRNYFNERNVHRNKEQRLYNLAILEDKQVADVYLDSDVKRMFRSARNYKSEIALQQAANAEISQTIQILVDSNHKAKEPFEFYTLRVDPPPDNRLPSPGLIYVPNQYHFGRVIIPTESAPETGFPPHPEIVKLINTKYPQYSSILDIYCRPLGTTDATFSDFNREQIPSEPVPNERITHILSLMKTKLNAKPYLPLHYVDTLFAKLPTSTGTGYHNRHSYRINAHAKTSHPQEYSDKPSSKGYYFNAFHEYSRFIIHLIKESGFPFEFTFSDTITEAETELFTKKLNAFFDSYPTLLFTRSHISKRLEALKQRPVYAVDELFLLIETMLLFPLLTQARSPDCCIMYGLETIRGSNAYIDKIAQAYQSFFTVDWSSFDQRLPRIITDIFFTHFVPSLLIVNQAYAPTHEYPSYPDLTPEQMYSKMNNLLSFLHTWFNNMTFLSQDGFAYRRTSAGVPSGQLATQYLDSFGNLFIVLDALIEFGATDPEIDAIMLLIMGDDNSGFTHWPIAKLEKFIDFLATYALRRYNMVISKTKSVITTLREKIETLGYTCNFGRPSRPIDKLVAQLCLPERSTKSAYMSARAIGLAYASCSCDYTFYSLCKDIHSLFLPYSDPSTPLSILKKFLPSQMMYLDDALPNIDFQKFPTFEAISSLVSTYQGPLTYHPKWDYTHFVHSPDYSPPDSITMEQYRILHRLPTFVPPNLM